MVIRKDRHNVAALHAEFDLLRQIATCYGLRYLCNGVHLICQVHAIMLMLSVRSCARTCVGSAPFTRWQDTCAPSCSRSNPTECFHWGHLLKGLQQSTQAKPTITFINTNRCALVTCVRVERAQSEERVDTIVRVGWSTKGEKMHPPARQNPNVAHRSTSAHFLLQQNGSAFRRSNQHAHGHLECTSVCPVRRPASKTKSIIVRLRAVPPCTPCSQCLEYRHGLQADKFVSQCHHPPAATKVLNSENMH